MRLLRSFDHLPYDCFCRIELTIYWLQIRKPAMKKFSKIIISILISIICPTLSADEYLGRIGSNPFCSDCTANPYALISNPFNPNSPRNPFGKYGNPYSPYSANNPNATQTLKVYGDAPDSGFGE